MVGTQHVVVFDGSEAYLPHLGRTAIPITFVHGAENECFLPESITRAIERLSAANGPSLYTNYPILTTATSTASSVATRFTTCSHDRRSPRGIRCLTTLTVRSRWI